MLVLYCSSGNKALKRLNVWGVFLLYFLYMAADNLIYPETVCMDCCLYRSNVSVVPQVILKAPHTLSHFPRCWLQNKNNSPTHSWIWLLCLQKEQLLSTMLHYGFRIQISLVAAIYLRCPLHEWEWACALWDWLPERSTTHLFTPRTVRLNCKCVFVNSGTKARLTSVFYWLSFFY